MKWVDHMTMMMASAACAKMLMDGQWGWMDAAGAVSLCGLSIYHMVKMWRTP